MALGFELVKSGEVVGLGRVDVGMVVGDAGEDGKIGVKFEEIAIVFVSFVDEIFVALVVIAAGGEA